MTLKLHHLNASRSQRIVWLLLELDVAHEIVHHSRHPETRLAPPALLDVHPMGKSPLLEHDGVVIAETGAIAQYLLAKFDTGNGLHPAPDHEDFPRFLEWVHAAEGSIFLPGLFRFYLMNGGLLDTPLAANMEAEQKKALDTVESHLAEHSYFAGSSFTAADCLMGFQMRSTHMQGGLETRPATKAWLEKVEARPAYKKMLEVGV